VTDPADLVHEVLIRVAEFIRKLPADQIADLASGEAKLDVVPKGGRRAAAVPAAALPRPAQEIATVMAEIGDRTAARRYLDVDLKLKVAQLKQLAAELGITVSGRLRAQLIDGIVEWAVGRRLDADAISRLGALR
jgi:hypothetical protein